jgi:crotonobetainyl-CoA:carnitine CoA-transferase CaiB-like acyl-CoA transferase
MPYNNGQWERFFKLIGKPELATNPRFHSMTTRTKNVDELYGLLAEEVSQRSTAWWLEALRREDIPVVPVKSADDLLRDEHLLARGFIKRFEHATEGTVVAMAPPIEMSSSPLSIRRLAPRLGGNTREILQELGYDEERITALFQERVVGTPSS